MIAFRVAVEGIEAAFKLSQNVDAAAREQVATWLGGQGAAPVVEAMRRVAERPSSL